MALSRKKKEAIVADMAERLGGMSALVVTEYRGLTVAEMSDIRNKLRESDATFHVIKLSLAKLAFEKAGLDPLPEDLLAGPVALAVLGEEVSAPSKALLKFEDDIDDLHVKGGLLEGTVLDAAGVEMMSKLPTREEVLGQIVGTIAAPSRQLVTVLAAPMRDLVGVINARVQAGEEEAA